MECFSLDLALNDEFYGIFIFSGEGEGQVVATLLDANNSKTYSLVKGEKEGSFNLKAEVAGEH
jgi:hypothetical protein